MGTGTKPAMPMVSPSLTWLRAMMLPCLIFLVCEPALAADKNSSASEPEGRVAVTPASSQAIRNVVDFRGTYSALVTGGTIGLQLEQAGEKVIGRLNGIQAAYEITGHVQQDGRIVGIAHSAKGRLYLNGQKEGLQIRLLLAEPAADGSIRQNQTRVIVFTPDRLSASLAPEPGRQTRGPQPASPAAVQAGLVGTKQCGQQHSACLSACSHVGGGLAGMNQCIANRCQPSYLKCMAGRPPNVTAADREWARQLSNSSAQIHQQTMQTYQQQIDSTHEFSRQQEERLNRERFGN